MLPEIQWMRMQLHDEVNKRGSLQKQAKVHERRHHSGMPFNSSLLVGGACHALPNTGSDTSGAPEVSDPEYNHLYAYRHANRQTIFII